MKVKRGDVLYADLSPVIGSEQGGIRPVVIIQNDMGNKYSPTVIIAAITSQQNKTNLPTHVQILCDINLPKNSVVLLEQIRTIDKRRLRDKVGSLDEKTMRKIDKSLIISLNLQDYMD
ncbi:MULTISPECIES: type II toxin-antitoxin system PemK/MazF family toxin [Helcococcus]|uniref:mRNA interferase n=1 Tax=Helcococcus bovis TaxID=3153252 RepID=A0ABW9F4D1_9FIRM